MEKLSNHKNPPLTTGQKCWSVVIMAVLAVFYTCCPPFEPVYSSHGIKDEYDYIVIGSGTAGSVIAHRLAQHSNISILVIEAGRHDYDTSIRVPAASSSLLDSDKNLVWNYRTQPQEHSAQGFMNNQMTLPLGKVLGGSSSIGDMVYGRGNPADFGTWGGSWSWDKLLPYFLRNEKALDIDSSKYHNTAGILPVSLGNGHCELSNAFSNAAQELKIKQVDYTSKEQLGVSQTLFTMMGGERWSAARAFLEPAVNKRYKVHLATSSVASKILFSGSRAVQVVFNQDGVNVPVRARKEIILTGGALETPKLLMLSGIGPSDELNRHRIPQVVDLPVGQGLKDPLKLLMRFKSGDKTLSVTKEKFNSAKSFLNYYFHKLGTWSETLQSQTTMFVNTKDETSKVPDVNINMLRAIATPNQAELLGVKYELEEAFNAGLYDSNTEGFTFLPTLLHPKSTGQVRLRSTGIHDPPLINPQYLSEVEDVDTLLRAVRYVQKLTKTKSLSPYITEPVPYPSQLPLDSDDYWRQAIRQFAFTTAQPSGTCAIGKVVNEDLTVKGVEGLRVVDSSVFPSTMSSDYTGVLYGVAERAADMILQSHPDN